MNTAERNPRPESATPEWKTEEYRGKEMHVRAKLRTPANPALAGHGQQWDFNVHVTEPNGSPTTSPCASAQSDQALFYSTQAIAEDMGFLRGRALIEAG